MIHNIREAFNEILEENEWMDDETKTVAKEKVKFWRVKPVTTYFSSKQLLHSRFAEHKN